MVVATSVPTREAGHVTLEEAVAADDSCGGAAAPWKVASAAVAAQPLSPATAGEEEKGGGSWRGEREETLARYRVREIKL